jgi:hypothetical protein
MTKKESELLTLIFEQDKLIQLLRSKLANLRGKL